jgi:chromosome segregation ATPase
MGLFDFLKSTPPDLTQLKADVATLKTSVQQLVTDTHALDAEMDTVTLTNQGNVMALKDLETKVEAVGANDIVHIKADLASLAGVVSMLGSAQNSLTQRVDGYDSEFKAATEIEQQLASDLAALKEESTKNLAIIGAVNEKLNVLQSIVDLKTAPLVFDDAMKNWMLNNPEAGALLAAAIDKAMGANG